MARRCLLFEIKFLAVSGLKFSPLVYIHFLRFSLGELDFKFSSREMICLSFSFFNEMIAQQLIKTFNFICQNWEAPLTTTASL